MERERERERERVWGSVYVKGLEYSVGPTKDLRFAPYAIYAFARVRENHLELIHISLSVGPTTKIRTGQNYSPLRISALL